MDGSSYGYAGEGTDASGLQYLRARYYSSAQGRFISKDPFPGLLTQPASLTPYVYALNSPVLYSDPSGEFIDTLFDAVSVGYDIYTIGDKLNRGCAIPWTDWAALGMDAFSLAVPFLPAAGMAIRFAAHADDLGDFARAVNKIADNIKLADKLGDSGKYGIRQIGSPCSFSEDTLVATQEGEKPIDEVEIGDKVLAYNENSHSTGYFPVVDKFVHLDQIIVTLVIDGETIETTSEHPFFTEEKGWIPAGELWIGALILRSDGLSGNVENIATQQSDRMMFNLTVDQAHTYFVGNGKWLVHNACSLRPYDIGTFEELSSRSSLGDNIQIHHSPQANPAQQVIPGYDYPNAPSIALPDIEHFAVNSTNVRGQYSGTAADLLEKSLIDLRLHTNAPESALQNLVQLWQKTWPGLFGGH